MSEVLRLETVGKVLSGIGAALLGYWGIFRVLMEMARNLACFHTSAGYWTVSPVIFPKGVSS